MKIYVASFNRASDGAIKKLVDKMKKQSLHTTNSPEADYILAVGDRKETFDFVLEQYRLNKPIMHLWAGEISQGTHDEVYRHSITLMSMLQLCISPQAKERVVSLCKAVDKKPNVYVVGNLFLDDLSIDMSLVPKESYILVLYNPPTLFSKNEIQKEIFDLRMKLESYKNEEHIKKTVWIEPNGDKYSDLLVPYVNQATVLRHCFLGLIKHCSYFFTNSSCQYTEAPFLLNPHQIVPVGKRNIQRESKYSNMVIKNASDNIIKVFKEVL